tara:strand:- start:3179 stop:3400 length:222 start_codon:yes stop_codon:yes gene_type:complete
VAKRKSTRKELETIIQAIDMRTYQGVRAMDYLVSAYIEYKGDTKDFEKFLEKKMDESKPKERKRSGKDIIISK